MSLSSFLLPASNKAKAKVIDKGLDDLFHATASVLPARPSAPVTPVASTSTAPSSEKKRKATEETISTKTKRPKSEATAVPSSSKRSVQAIKRAKVVENESNSEDSGEDGEEEDRDEGEESDESGEASDSDDEGGPPHIVHESLTQGAQRKGQSRNGKAKYIPEEETSEQRDARTIFVGNVAVEVTKSRPTQKQLKRHILSFVPSAKIESVRFRSVGFKNPTADLPSLDGGEGKPRPKTREHDRDRAASWRGDDKDEAQAEAISAKRFLAPKEKKRIAFIKHEIHDLVDSVNAYVVFALQPPPESLAKRPANVPPPPPVMDAYEAARVCAAKCDGSVFLGRTLRVDVAKKGARSAPAGEGGGAGREGAMAGDPKATVFVGSLDFASKEEDLRAFFESLVTAERGQPEEKKDGESDESEDEEDEETEEGAKNEKKPPTWVKRVRIIRDRDTQLGKGFAYVQFTDRECVDEILALDQSKLKFAKRKLRVQRCKTLPGGPKLRAARPSNPNASRPSSSSAPSSGRPGSSRPLPATRLVPASKHIPKGNPELGAKLAHLPKEERKKAKAEDPDRVARRIAKKRAKALAEKGVKARTDRERVRKRPNEKGVQAKGRGQEKPKKRVRSGKALAKMNTKK